MNFNEKGELVITKPSLVYNPKNKLIERKVIHRILMEAGINNKVNNLDIWQKAFIHNSYSKKFKKNKKYTGFLDQEEEKEEDKDFDISSCLPIQEDSNESMEWLGDSMLQAVSGAYLFKRFPEQDEGFRTKLRSKLVRTDSLARFAKNYGMDEYVMISRHLEENRNGRDTAHILEDVFEAFIGAIYLDFGEKDEGKAYNLCRRFIIHTFENYADFTDLILNDDNYKDQLMRFYQRHFEGATPKYEQEDYDEEDKTFTMIVKHPLTEMIVGRGKAKNKKQGEQLSAKQALKFFEDKR